MSKLCEKLCRIQTELKAPKNLYNKFGKYNYRNAEGICEAVKPYLKKENCALILTDDIVAVANRFYVKATAKFIDCETGNEELVNAYAREEEEKKGMDGSQITGSASSYARKYALNGLFLLDDTKDADTDEQHVETQNRTKTETGAKAKYNLVKKQCEKNNIDIPKLCKLYKKATLEELTETHLENIIKNFDQVKMMCGKNNITHDARANQEVD